MCFGLLQTLDGAGTVEDPDRTYNDIHEIADDLRSLAISIRESAFRQGSAWLLIQRAKFAQQANLLAGLIRDIAPLEGEGGAN
jgi:hypothetical protein